MSKRAESGEVIKQGPPPKPQRRFPWRLWLWALVMTAGAGAGAFFTWQYRGQAIAATAEAESSKTTLVTATAATRKAADAACDVDKKKAAGDLLTVKTASDAHAKELEKQLTDLGAKLGTT
jgi:uncharacterized protein HemX